MVQAPPPRTDEGDAIVCSRTRDRIALVLVACVTGFAGLAAWVVSVQGHVGVDRRIAVAVANHRTASATTVMSVVTRLGSGPAAGLVLLLLGALALRQRDARTFQAVAMAVAAATLSSQAFKHAVNRPRPGKAYALGHLASASFPSGHATMAAALWGSLALAAWAARPTPRSARLLAGGWAVIAVAVAASRVELGVHWTTDVTAGLLLGTACVAATALLLGMTDETRGSRRHPGSRSDHQESLAVAIEPRAIGTSAPASPPSVGARPPAAGSRHPE